MKLQFYCRRKMLGGHVAMAGQNALVPIISGEAFVFVLDFFCYILSETEGFYQEKKVDRVQQQKEDFLY